METNEMQDFMKNLFKALVETIQEENQKTNEKLDNIALLIEKHSNNKEN